MNVQRREVGAMERRWSGDNNKTDQGSVLWCEDHNIRYVVSLSREVGGSRLAMMFRREIGSSFDILAGSRNIATCSLK